MSYVGPNTLKHFVQKYFGDPDNIKGLGDGTVTGAIKALLTRVTGTESSIKTLNDSLASVKSHVGMIIQSTALDTESKVKAIYGGSKWTMISGRFLLGAAAGEAGQTGGAEKHNHVMPMGFDPNFIYCHCGTDGLPALGSETTTGFRITANMSNGITSGEIRDGITGQASNLPPYKKVYIWERTA